MKTRESLLDAFRDLVLSRGYSALTIGAVAAAARTGRSTFYEHFSGKHDLLRQSLAGPFGALAATVDSSRSPIDFINMLTHFRAQRRFARVLFAGSTRQLITRCLADLIEEQLAGIEMKLTPLPRGLVAFQIAGSHLALIEGWIWGGMPWSVEMLACALVQGARRATEQNVE